MIAFGSVSKLLWGGLRVGWIRVDEPLRTTVVAQKAAVSLATTAVSQALTAQLLAAVGPAWLGAHRRALAERRDHLAGLLASHLPAWRTGRPAAGLSLWVELPLDSADAFAHVAARHGVTIAAGSTACLDQRHHRYIRLSFAERPDTLELAVQRLAVAWEAHTENLAASPASGYAGSAVALAQRHREAGLAPRPAASAAAGGVAPAPPRSGPRQPA